MIKKIIIGQLSFFSAIPVKSNYSIDEIAKYSFLAPIIVGVLLGIIEFLSYSILYIFFANLASILLLGIIELLRGFNHLDGLLDLGDALMVKGDRERKIRALKDTQVGSGGIGLLILYLSIQIVALIKLNGISVLSLLSIISADVLSRSLSLSALGTIKPMPESFLGKIFHESLKGRTSIIIIESVVFLSLYSIIAYIILYVIFYKICSSLGGSSGDITGAFITLSFPLFLLINEVTNLNYSILSLLCFSFLHLR
ncbi:MAG: adenosylcobinamide-GDP ribazoletransferase [Saccharolobus sp.]